MASLKGKLLLASPDLVDPNFHQTVVLMVQHDDNGALGLVLNRPTATPLRQDWSEVSDVPCAREELLHQGGPVPGPLMVLHRQADRGDIEVLPEVTEAPGVHFTAEAEKVEWLVQYDSGDIRFFVGYAGWAAGQLDQEMETGSWLVLPATSGEVFQAAADQWPRLMRCFLPGVNPRILPRDPSHN